MIKTGIIGYGYWGPNLVRNFIANNKFEVVMVSDTRKERLDIVKKFFPSIKVTQTYEEILKNSEINAIAIATPVYTHFDIARKALKAGKHIVIEKPMTSNSKEAEELINLALKRKLILMVDHTFLYTGAVQKIKRIVNEKELGNIKYIDSTRINLGLFQPDINVLWDLAPHDISILTHLINENPYSVNATGISHTANNIANIAYLTVNFNSGLIAHFNCSWSSPVKVRMMLIGGDKKMILYNDLEPTEKIKVYDTGYEVRTDEEKQKLLIDYRTGDIFIPKVPTTEALSLMVEDFASAINENSTPVASFESGLNVIRILEASSLSLESGGKEIVLKY